MRSGSSSQLLQDLQNAPSCTKGLLLDGKFYFLMSFYQSIVYCLIEDWSFSSSSKNKPSFSLPFIYATLDSCSYLCPSLRGNF